MSDTQSLLAEIEATAALLGIAPSTVGERAGQGGHFYRRLRAGKRVWPDTARKVRGELARMRRAACEDSHSYVIKYDKGAEA
jgi:ribosomal protein L19E